MKFMNYPFFEREAKSLGMWGNSRSTVKYDQLQLIKFTILERVPYFLSILHFFSKLSPIMVAQPPSIWALFFWVMFQLQCIQSNRNTELWSIQITELWCAAVKGVFHIIGGWENQPSSPDLCIYYRDSILKVGWPSPMEGVDRPWQPNGVTVSMWVSQQAFLLSTGFWGLTLYGCSFQNSSPITIESQDIFKICCHPARRC